MKHLTLVLSLCLMLTATFAQKRTYYPLHLGLGVGFDHGGFGTKVAFQPAEHLGVFAGIGYNLANIGVNGGIFLNVLPKARVTPVITAMYGYNAVIKVEYTGTGTSVSDYGVYSGLTIGAGADFKLGRRKAHKISTMLNLPFRSAGFFRQYRFIRENADSFQDIPPIAVSVGYSIGIGGNW